MVIKVPLCDPDMDSMCTNTQTLDMERSESTGSPRNQINALTAWLDASQIYGTSQSLGDSLRTFSRGKLALTVNDTLIANAMGGYLAGDVRAN